MWKYLIAGAILILATLGLIIHVQNKRAAKDTRTTRRKVHVPKIMLDLYHQNARGNVVTGPDIVRSVIPKTTGFSSETKSQSFETKHVLIFEVPKYADEEFLSAELKVLSIVEGELADLETLFKISMFDDANGNVLYLDRVRFHRTNSTWLSFNLTAPIASVLSEAAPRIRIVIALRSMLDGARLTLLPDEEDYEHDYPVLLLSYNSKLEANRTTASTRNKRSVFEEDYPEDANEKRQRPKKMKNVCKRKALYVDFAEINYDTWIMQPSGYEAYQCQGKCFYPVADHLSPTKHAIVQALLHSVAPSKATRSCCVPTKLDSISVLYIDANGVLTYRYAYKDMVVSECGCR